jgi:hypothetical protein
MYCCSIYIACRVGRQTGGLLTEIPELRLRGPLLGFKRQHPIGSRLEGPAMLLRQVPTTHINSAGYIGQLSLNGQRMNG